jgi:hypothetical protein
MRPTQPPIKSVPEAFSSGGGGERMGREADHSPHLQPRIGMFGTIPPCPQYVFMLCLIKQ